MTAILLLNSDKDIAMLTKAFLEFSGYGVLLAETVETALTLAESNQLDFAVYYFGSLADDVLGIVEQLTTQQSLAQVPYLVFTAKSPDKLRTASFSISEKSVFQSPMIFAPFLKRIQEILKDATSA